MARRPSRSGGRVTPKGGGPGDVPGPRRSSRRPVSWVALVLVVLILAGLVVGALGTALLFGGGTQAPVPGFVQIPHGR